MPWFTFLLNVSLYKCHMAPSFNSSVSFYSTFMYLLAFPTPSPCLATTFLSYFPTYPPFFPTQIPTILPACSFTPGWSPVSWVILLGLTSVIVQPSITPDAPCFSVFIPFIFIDCALSGFSPTSFLSLHTIRCHLQTQWSQVPSDWTGLPPCPSPLSANANSELISNVFQSLPWTRLSLWQHHGTTEITKKNGIFFVFTSWPPRPTTQAEFNWKHFYWASILFLISPTRNIYFQWKCKLFSWRIQEKLHRKSVRACNLTRMYKMFRFVAFCGLYLTEQRFQLCNCIHVDAWKSL